MVVTLDASDGHRDHVAIRDATLTAVDASAHPVAATYLVCLARSSMTRGADRMRMTGGGDAYLTMAELGTPDADITLAVDVEEHLATRWAAIRAHGRTLPHAASAARMPRRRIRRAGVTTG